MTTTLIMYSLYPLLVGVALQLLLTRFLSTRAKGIMATLCCVVSLAAVILSYSFIRSGGAVDWNLLPWDGPLAFSFHFDGLSFLFSIMGTGIGAIVLLYSIDYMVGKSSVTRFYCFMLTFIAGLVALVYSANLFLFYLCWEVVGLCSFNLVGFWYEKKESVAGARKVLLMTHLAGYGLLAAILMLYHRTGSALWTDPRISGAFTSGLFVLVLISVIAKSVQFPLHTWIPEAMAAPTPVSALLHAACYVKAGIYLLARMHSWGPWPVSWNVAVMWLGIVTMVVGVLYAMVTTDLKRMLAFHTVSQIGYMVTGIGIGTPLGITAGLLHCFNHGLFKGGLFLAAGSVQHATDTRNMNELGGLAGRMPRTTAFWLINAGSIAGIPLLSGFVSKWMLYTAAMQSGQIAPAIIPWLVSGGTVFSFLKATDTVFFGTPNARTAKAEESPATMQWAMGALAVGSIILGIAPQIAIRYLINPLLPALGLHSAVQVSWLGITASGDSWWVTGGFGLAILSAVLGLIIFAVIDYLRAPVQVPKLAIATSGGGVFSGGEPILSCGKFTASDFSAVVHSTFRPFYRVTDVDRFYLACWNLLQRLTAAVKHGAAWLEKHAIACIVTFGITMAVGIRFALPRFTATTQAPEVSLPSVLVWCTLAGIGLILTAFSLKAWKHIVPLMTATFLLALGGISSGSPVARLGFLELATFATAILVWNCVVSRSAAWTYLTVALLSGSAIIGSLLLGRLGAPEWATAILISGFLLKLAAVPFFFWLNKISEALPPVVTGLVVAVIDISAFSELATVAQTQPSVFAMRGLWLGVAISSALIGSLLMLAEKNLKRLLALSTIEDLGFLTLGVASLSSIGMTGALIGASVHALAKALLFICISTPDRDGMLNSESRGLATHYPVSAAGFLVGMLAVLGIPPTFGFAARWRLYETAAQEGSWILLAFLTASAFTLLAYVRALTKFWWGAATDDESVKPEPSYLWPVVVESIILLIVLGLWPDALNAIPEVVAGSLVCCFVGFCFCHKRTKTIEIPDWDEITLPSYTPQTGNLGPLSQLPLTGTGLMGALIFNNYPTSANRSR